MRLRIITIVISFALLGAIPVWGQTNVIKRQGNTVKQSTTTAKRPAKSQVNVTPQKQEKGIYYVCLNFGYNLSWSQQICREMRAKGYPAFVVADGEGFILNSPSKSDCGYMCCVKSFKNRQDVAAFCKSFSDSRYNIYAIRYNNHDISSWSTGLSTEQLLLMNGNQLYQLAEDYYFGKNGKSKDISNAQHCYYQAAYIDYVPAQLRLGQLYEEGGGTYSWEFKKDLKAATYWYKQAAAQGDDTAKKALQRLNSD